MAELHITSIEDAQCDYLEQFMTKRVRTITVMLWCMCTITLATLTLMVLL